MAGSPGRSALATAFFFSFSSHFGQLKWWGGAGRGGAGRGGAGRRARGGGRGVGCWVLGVGCWVLGVGCWVLGVGWGDVVGVGASEIR